MFGYFQQLTEEWSQLSDRFVTSQGSSNHVISVGVLANLATKRIIEYICQKQLSDTGGNVHDLLK